MDDDARTRIDGISSATHPGVEGEPPPLRVGRFFIFRRLGEGGMGQVLLGYDEELSRKLAIKLWRTSRGKADELSARMLREAQALARLSHPNVVQAYEVGDHHGQLYLAMEYIEGSTLREWVHDQRPPLPLLLDRYIQAGRGLAAAHRAGLLHRDFKPDNAVVGADGRVRVLDFGLARADTNLSEESADRALEQPIGTDSFEAPLTRAGSVLGTPAYMPPEQLVGGVTDVRADVYAFCVSLWEAIHGLRPFTGSNFAELTAAIRGERPREAARPPGWLRRALLRGLAADPAARWPSMDALLEVLESGTRRRRLRLVGAASLGLLGLAGGLLGLHQWDRARAVSACEARGRALADVWSDDARAAVRAAILASDQPGAEATHARVDALLERFASTWSEAQVTACRRHDLERAWDPDTVARADACLGELRWSLEGLVDALRDADATVVQRAVEAASSLPDVGLCLDEDALARRPRLPADPAARAAIDALRRDLERALSLQAAGRYEAGYALAEGLIERADALGWPPLAARVRLVAGALAVTLRREDTAATTRLLEDAVFTALDAGDDLLAVRTAVQLADHVGTVLIRPADGERWIRLARALLPRLGTERALVEASVECTAGGLARFRGLVDEADAGYRRCVDLRAGVLGAEHPLTGLALARLGGVAELRGDSADARRRFEQALAILEPAFGPEHPVVGRQLSELANTLVELDELDLAERLLRRALAINERAGGNGGRTAMDLFRLAGVLQGRGAFEEARAALERSRALFDAAPATSLPMRIAVRMRLSDLHRRRHDVDAALGAAIEVAGLLESHDSKAPEYARTLLTIADHRLTRGEVDEARAQIERAGPLLDAFGPTDAGDLLVDLGELHRRLGEYDRAEALFARARERIEATPELRPQLLCGPLVALGELALDRGAAADAVPLLTRAVDLGGAPGDPAHLARARFALARALVQVGRDAPRARELAEQAAATYAARGLDRELASVRTWLSGHVPS